MKSHNYTVIAENKLLQCEDCGFKVYLHNKFLKELAEVYTKIMILKGLIDYDEFSKLVENFSDKITYFYINTLNFRVPMFVFNNELHTSKELEDRFNVKDMDSAVNIYNFLKEIKVKFEFFKPDFRRECIKNGVDL